MGQNPNLVCIMNWWFGVLGIWDFDEWFYENVELTYEFRRRKKKKGILGILKKAVENKETTIIILSPLNGDESLRHVCLDHPVHLWSLHLKKHNTAAKVSDKGNKGQVNFWNGFWAVQEHWADYRDSLEGIQQKSIKSWVPLKRIGEKMFVLCFSSQQDLGVKTTKQ